MSLPTQPALPGPYGLGPEEHAHLHRDGYLVREGAVEPRGVKEIGTACEASSSV